MWQRSWPHAANVFSFKLPHFMHTCALCHATYGLIWQHVCKNATWDTHIHTSVPTVPPLLPSLRCEPFVCPRPLSIPLLPSRCRCSSWGDKTSSDCSPSPTRPLFPLPRSTFTQLFLICSSACFKYLCVCVCEYGTDESCPLGFILCFLCLFSGKGSRDLKRQNSVVSCNASDALVLYVSIIVLFVRVSIIS